jgi:hypothetical protein
MRAGQYAFFLGSIGADDFSMKVALCLIEVIGLLKSMTF